MYNHEQEVYAFFRKKKEEDPEGYKELCERYPIISIDGWKAIFKREITVGLTVEKHPFHEDEGDV